MIKLTIIGAGSAVFTKNIVVDLLHISSFKNMHISLMDIDEKRLNKTYEILKIISTKVSANPLITKHTKRKEALKNADFVQTSIQVGGYKPSTLIDFEIPKKYGLKQTIADTLGIGGIMRGLRTIPVLLDISKDYGKQKITQIPNHMLWDVFDAMPKDIQNKLLDNPTFLKLGQKAQDIVKPRYETPGMLEHDVHAIPDEVILKQFGIIKE